MFFLFLPLVAILFCGETILAILVQGHGEILLQSYLKSIHRLEMSGHQFNFSFSIFNSGSHLVQWRETAVLSQGHERNISLKLF